jgi:hypothetical protein
MRRRIALAVATCFVLAGPATADAIRVHYRADLAGVEIGALRVEVDADRYRNVFDGSFGPPDKPAAVRVTAAAVGQLLFGRIQPLIEAKLGWGRLLLETTDPRPFQAATRAAALR